MKVHDYPVDRGYIHARDFSRYFLKYHGKNEKTTKGLYQPSRERGTAINGYFSYKYAHGFNDEIFEFKPVINPCFKSDDVYVTEGKTIGIN